MQDKFLQQVADYYLDKSADLTRTTFVFPNRRAAMFMRKYMQQAYDDGRVPGHQPVFMPRMVSITYFLQQYDSASLASPTELVFILYRAYCRLIKDKDLVPDFDRFYFWGSMILNDFNDVDSSLTDATELYRNLKGLKEIRAEYLTDEQREVIKYLWGDEFVPSNDDDSFWAHIKGPDDTDSAEAKFLHLWEVMGQLYKEFVTDLASQPVPLTYAGLQSRHAYERIKEMGADDFGGRRFVMVGFNVLSTSRVKMFSRLRDLGVADFFWDTASVSAIKGGGAVDFASKYVVSLAHKFPMPADFELQPISTVPDIEIISVPSNFGQAKVASHIIDQWTRQWQAQGDESRLTPDGLVDTAVIMADERLLTPMLFSIPEQIQAVNVTMGVSYSSTPFAALMSAIISMHLRARQRQGTFYYYYQDVVNVLSNPHIALVVPAQSQALKDKILVRHIYNVSADEIIADFPDLAFIFRQISDDRDIDQVRGYIDNLVSTLQNLLRAATPNQHDQQPYELRILDGYAQAVNELCSLIQRYEIGLRERTFLQMIERALSISSVNFIGKPLKGLQLMGIMDTRALDFRDIIITSLNERTFPKRNFTPSFIPMSLRAAYGLPTQQLEENSYAYQFARLLARADRVRLLYDSRTSGVSSGEMSRYLSQLLYLNKDLNIKVKAIDLKALAEPHTTITVDKTPDVIRDLRRFRPGGDLKLSASALKNYLLCPLKFYLQFVKQMRADEDVIEYIDASSYGTVIHKVVEDLYMQHAGETITAETIDAMMADDIEARALVTLNEKYYHGHFSSDLSRIPGEGQVVARIIARYVRGMLEHEKKMVPFTFRGAEVGEHKKHVWRINDDYTLNFTMSIDRIDSFDDPENPGTEALRFIDYKTGSDSLEAKTVDELFTEKTLGGMMQLLLYSYAYASDSISGDKRRIKPLIYKFQEIPSKGISDLKFESKPIEDYRQVEGFYEKFEQVIDQIFEEENKYPFCQTDDLEHCRYCPFLQLCRRYPPEKKVY